MEGGDYPRAIGYGTGLILARTCHAVLNWRGRRACHGGADARRVVDTGTEAGDHVIRPLQSIARSHGFISIGGLLQQQWHKNTGMAGNSAFLQTPLLIANEEDGVVDTDGNTYPGPKSRLPPRAPSANRPPRQHPITPRRGKTPQGKL
jgi:hypothetical protein